MYDRLDDIPVLASRQRKVVAAHYNHVQKALKRLGPEIRLSLPGLKHLDLIMQKNAWIIVDRVLNDYPVVAWTGFEVQGRDSLHEDIGCEIKFYHANASMIMNRALEAMDLMLGEQLGELDDMRPASVISINKDRK
ncbi:MAG: DUF3352 domain-containing protein [Gammaproteobacteria bacterium]|nr:DUF3352 domain-containing protein [Gammaproteobacteria bacterium]